MTLNTKPRMDVVKREDKEEKLKNFISNYLTASTSVGDIRSWRLIARSPESPVVLALTALAPALQAASITVQTVFAQDLFSAPDSAAFAAIGYTGEVRVVRDIRLLDAHEQLHIDIMTVWVGDCMRREPAKRDAYECYASDCAETADWSLKAFNRLWSRAEPVIAAQPSPANQANAIPDMGSCPLPANQVPSTIVALTRH